MPTTLLHFTQTGLQEKVHATATSLNETTGDILVFTDGSLEGHRTMRQWSRDVAVELKDRSRLVWMRTPLYAMRLRSASGELSSPHYLFNEHDRIRWICSQVAAPQLEIFLSDVTDIGGTQAKQTRERTEVICYLAYRLWDLLLTAEERLCFPAAALDRLARWTYRLTPQTIDIDLLRQETGIASLDYNQATEMLSLTIGGEIFLVKLSVLNSLYGELILPRFNRVYGRRLRISVSVIGHSGERSTPIEMSYGELGRVIEGMRQVVQEQLTTPESPVDPIDLMILSRQARRGPENSLQVDPDADLEAILDAHRQWFIPTSSPDDSGGDNDADTVPPIPTKIH